MTSAYTIFAVDDDEVIRLLIGSMLSDDYQVEVFDSAEACLERVDARQPDLFLLDVSLPGMNGYELCRTLKAKSVTACCPVIFLSSLDKASDVLSGYDAGGEDYVVKPFNPIILKRQIASLSRTDETKRRLQATAGCSEEVAAETLANLDEYAILIRFLRSLNECDDKRALLESLFQLLRAYKLQCAIQIRLPGRETTVSEAGVNRPLEVAVINNVRSMERIFEFKQRAAFNFETITILANNMPLADPSLCGRLRDHLLIAAECANSKLISQQASAENVRTKTTATQLIGRMNGIITELAQATHRARYARSMQTQLLLEQLAHAFASLGLSEEQEMRIDGIVRESTERYAEIYDFSEAIQHTLTDVASCLGEMLAPPATDADATIDSAGDWAPTGEPGSGGALF